MQGIIGKKVGMTRLFNGESCEATPVTIIQAGVNIVQQVKTVEKDGYSAVQLGSDICSEKKISKPQAGHFKKHNSEPTKMIKEFKLDSPEEKLESGQKVGVEIFKDVPFVDVIGISKGRGFTGTIKRHGFSIGRMTHGNTDRRRAGSVGSNTCPAHVRMGKRMAGHSGNEQVTMKALKVIKLDKDNGLIFIKGSIPGKTKGIVFVRKNKKRI